MKDIFKEYKSKKLKRNIVIISLSLVFAISINLFLFNTNVWNKLQTSVKNYNEKDKDTNKDIYLEKSAEWSDILNLVLGTWLRNVSEIRTSILFDPAKIKLVDFFSENKNINITKISNIPGVFLLNIKYTESLNLPTNTNILKISYTKINDEKTVINLAETMFISDKKAYSLTNENLEF